MVWSEFKITFFVKNSIMHLTSNFMYKRKCLFAHCHHKRHYCSFICQSDFREKEILVRKIHQNQTMLNL